MQPSVVSDILAVGEVPEPGHLEILAKAGFKSVINCQPDGEVERFAGSAALGAEAARHGLGYVYAPIVSRMPSEVELSVFQRALGQLAAPVYAFCYSGSRSAAAAAFVETGRSEPDAVVAAFAAAGFDIASLKPWLEDERKRRAPGDNGVSAANGGVVAGNGTRISAPGKGQEAPGSAMEAVPVAATAALSLQGIVVHARAAGSSGFAVAG